ncbi:transposase family protein, partial [Modestobacter lapidis]|nr:transposase family protein [Modestobacter lapidis]
MRTNIICRFGIPKRFVHDNGPQFRDHRFYRFCDKYKIQSCPSTPYNPAANGLAEAFNKTLCKILKK